MGMLFTTEEKRLKDVEKATASLDLAIKEKKKAYTRYNDYMNGEAGAWDSAYVGSEDAQRRGEELLETYKNAVLREEKAREELWSAKYDTMPNEQLQVAVIEVEDEKEKDYIKKVQSNRVAEQRKKDLKTMNSIGDPESVLYDPDFQEKSTYHSTKLPEGELGESDTGYADIDHEFINNNPDISELIVGKERNYYQFFELERRINNYRTNHLKERKNYVNHKNAHRSGKSAFAAGRSRRGGEVGHGHRLRRRIHPGIYRGGCSRAAFPGGEAAVPA